MYIFILERNYTVILNLDWRVKHYAFELELGGINIYTYL